MNQNSQENNLAFIDGQNLYMGTTMSSKKPWQVNLLKFRIYLKDKYRITKAYYYLGYQEEKYQKLYENIQGAGFVLMFRKHNSYMIGTKKGNVDTDIIFDVMEKVYEKEPFDKIVLVSGDGDYKKLVDFLIKKNRFEKILFPNWKFASSLLRALGTEYFDCLENDGVKKKIA